MPTALLAQHAADHGGGPLVLDLLAILAAAAVVTLALRRVHLATIPGFLITGAVLGVLVDLVGAHIGILTNPENIDSIGGLATILLMFTIGLHMDLEAIRKGMVHILLLGITSTLLVVAITWPTGMLFGLSAPVALAVAMALSMSSTAVVLRILQQRRESHRVHGRIVFGVLIVQDLLVLVFLAVLPPLANWAGVHMGGVAGEAEDAVTGPKLFGLIAAAALALGGIALLILFGRTILPRLLREAAKDASAEVMLVLSAAVALGAAVLTGALGFSPELGAFLAGFLLASTPFRAQLAGQLAPMRDLFMAVFFTAVGLRMHIVEIAPEWWIVLLGLVAVVSIKAVVNGVTAWALGASAGVAAVTGLALAQAGEFSLVILSSAGGLGMIPETTLALVIAVVVLSLIVTPAVFNLGVMLRPHLADLRMAPWITAAALRDHHDTGPELSAAAPHANHVIIAGYGVVGRAVADQFDVAGIPFTVVELNPATVRRQSQLGRSIVYGDISNPEVLHAAGIERADSVVLTVPDDDAVFKACQAIRAAAPGVFIAVRTGYLSSAFRATGLGADHVTVAEVATAEAMARQVMQQMHRRGRVTPPQESNAGFPARNPVSSA